MDALLSGAFEVLGYVAVHSDGKANQGEMKSFQMITNFSSFDSDLEASVENRAPRQSKASLCGMFWLIGTETCGWYKDNSTFSLTRGNSG